MSIATAPLVRHVQEFAYRERPFITDFSAAPKAAERFEEQLFFGVLGYEQRSFADARTMLSLAAGQDDAGGDAAQFYLGLVQAQLGDGNGAFASLLGAFGRGLRLPAALLEAARLALRLGDEATAIAVFRQLVTAAGDQPAFRRVLDLTELHAYNSALAGASPRVASLMAPCSLLGAAAPVLGRRQDRVIGTLLDATREDWEQQRIAAPANAGRWTVTDRPAQPLRVLQVFARYTNCSERYVDNEFLHHFHRSATARGHESRVFRADKILYGPGALPPDRVIDGLPFEPTPETLRTELEALREAIEEFQPDVVMLEGNFLPAETTISPAFFAALPARKRFALIVVVPDLYDTAPDFMGAWVGAADRVLCFNEDSQRFEQQRAGGKMIYFPSLPFGRNADAFGPKPHDFVFAGGVYRQRDAILSAIARHVPGARIVGSTRERASGFPGVDDFNRFLAQGKTTFNTGYLDPRHPAIQTGRVVEAMLARTALLEESSSSVARCYVPNLHFLPVAHGAQAVAYSQFLASHEAHREAMVDSALEMVEQHYSPAHFWHAIETSL